MSVHFFLSIFVRDLPFLTNFCLWYFFWIFYKVFLEIRLNYRRHRFFLKTTGNSGPVYSNLFTAFVSNYFVEISFRFFQFVSLNLILSGLILIRFLIWLNFKRFHRLKSISILIHIRFIVNLTGFRLS